MLRLALMADAIDVCREKIRRAESRLDELKEEIGTFFEGNEPYDIPGDYDAKTKTFTFYFKTRGDPPPSLDTIIGEIAHGLRSALNNLATALSRTPDADGDFPIFTDEADFLARGKPKTKELRAEHRRAIECLQPYNRREPDETPLAILNRLARMDKHRSGTFKVILNVFGNFHFQAIRDIAGYGESVLYAGVMENGDPLAEVEVIPDGPQPELHIKVDFTAGVAFGEKWTLPHPFPRLIAEVRDIVDAFAPQS
jgi:hypothetical protein